MHVLKKLGVAVLEGAVVFLKVVVAVAAVRSAATSTALERVSCERHTYRS